MSRTFVIGEIGSCHDGSFEKAKRLIRAALDAGCNAAKGQFWSSSDRMAARRRNADDYLAVYRRGQMPVEWLPRLRGYAESIGIEWACSTYLPEDVRVVAPFVKLFKVSSFENTSEGMIRAHRAAGKRVLVSTGLTDHDGMWRLRTSWESVDVEFLHCTSGYPTPSEDMNLAAIREYKLDGYSDHSGLIEGGQAAVHHGARIVEVHVRLEDSNAENPDAGEHALLPEDLRAYVGWIRQAEVMSGSGRKHVMPSEASMARYQVRA